jgi:hypothetical protein
LPKKGEEVMESGIKKVLSVLMALLLVFHTPAYAFKAKTHVWIAEQVVQDIKDGYIDIEVDGVKKKYKVDPAVASAILANPAIYRMGNIGPDVAPDVIAGQTVIHPGVEDGQSGWGSDDWAMMLDGYVNNLDSRVSDEDYYAFKKAQCGQREYNTDMMGDVIEKYFGVSGASSGDGSQIILSLFLDEVADEINPDSAPAAAQHARSVEPVEVAYLYGFLGHMSSDVFGHSYVNHYAGDLFHLDGEVTVEKRHGAIENYIDNHLPVDATFKPELMIDSPTALVTDAFILNRQSGEALKEKVPYLYAWGRMNHALKETASSCVWTFIDIIGAKVVANEFTGYMPNEQQAKMMNEVMDKLNRSGEYQGEEFRDLLDHVDEIVADGLDYHYEALDSSVKALNDLYITANYYQSKVDQAALDAAQLACQIEAKGCLDGCEVNEKLIPGFDKSSCKEFCFATHATCVSYFTLAHSYEYNIKMRNAAVAGVTSQAREQVEKIYNTLVSIQQAGTEVRNLLVDVWLLPNRDDMNPVQTLFRQWQQEVRLSAGRWVDANQQVMKNGLVAKAAGPSAADQQCWDISTPLKDCLTGTNQEMLQPISQWREAYSEAILGIPQSLRNAMGAVGMEAVNISQLNSDGVDYSELDFRPDPTGNIGLQEQKKVNILNKMTAIAVMQLERNISRYLPEVDVVAETAKLLAGEEAEQKYQDLYAVSLPAADDESINDLFTSDLSGKDLVVYDDIITQFRMDMGVSANGKLTTAQFNALYNAIVLAKLSLLKNDELNRLAGDLGMAACSNCQENVLYRAVRSMDGHQQWQEYAGDLPRDKGGNFQQSSDATTLYNNHFGYGASDGGFRFYQAGASEQALEKIFRFPLVRDNLLPGVLIPAWGLLLQ